MYKLFENTDQNGTFYVYELIDPTDNKPFYIGKGKGNRYEHHFDFNNKRNRNKHKINKIKKIINGGNEVIIKIILRSDDEKMILEKECEMIKKYGRFDKKTGILTNLTDGGEGMSGYIPSDETKNKWSISRSGKNNGMYDKKHTETSILKMSETRKEKYRTGEILPTKHSEEWIKNLRENNPNYKKIDDNLLNLMIQLNSVGMSLPEISKKTGLSIGTIQRRLKTYKIDVNFKKEKNIDIPFVLTKLREGFTKKQICNLLSISYSTLARKIKIYEEETSIL